MLSHCYEKKNTKKNHKQIQNNDIWITNALMFFKLIQATHLLTIYEANASRDETVTMSGSEGRAGLRTDGNKNELAK